MVDVRQTVIASSDNVAGRPPVATLAPAVDESLAVTIKDPAGLDGTFRVVAVAADDAEPVTVYVGTDLKQADSTTVLLTSALVVAVPLLLALVAGMTWVAVGRSLRPVEAIRRQVADVSPTDPGVRVPVPGTDDEVRRLAVTMNAMLDRLQASSEREARFVADASHELQTPIAAARTELEVALTSAPTGGRRSRSGSSRRTGRWSGWSLTSCSSRAPTTVPHAPYPPRWISTTSSSTRSPGCVRPRASGSTRGASPLPSSTVVATTWYASSGTCWTTRSVTRAWRLAFGCAPWAARPY